MTIMQIPRVVTELERHDHHANSITEFSNNVFANMLGIEIIKTMITSIFLTLDMIEHCLGKPV